MECKYHTIVGTIFYILGYELALAFSFRQKNVRKFHGSKNVRKLFQKSACTAWHYIKVSFSWIYLPIYCQIFTEIFWLFNSDLRVSALFQRTMK